MEKTNKSFKELLFQFIVKNKTWITLVVCLLIMFLCTIMLFVKNGNIYCDDINFHARRIQSIADGLKGGQFPVKYYDSWFNGAGYISSLFYGDVFLYLPALFVLIGIPLKVAYWVFVLMIYFLIAVTMFFLARKFFDRTWSIICATIFTISQYIFVDVFFRGAVGEITAIIFMIILFIGIYNLLKENYSKPWLLLISFIGMLWSHMTSLIIAVVILVIFVLCNAKTLFKQKSFWLKSLFVFAIFVFVGAYQLFSFLEMYFADTYCISEGWAVISNYAYNLFDIFFVRVYGMGYIMFLPFLLRCFIRKDEENSETIKFLNKLLIISGILILVISAAFPWGYFQNTPISMLQFPWRLNTIPTGMLSIALIIELQCLIQSKVKLKKCLFALVLCFIAVFCPIFNNLALFHYDRSYTEWDTPWEVGLIAEYAPLVLKHVNEEWWWNTDLLDEHNHTVEYERKPNTTNLTFVSDEENTYYDLPIIYYKGYSATITLDDGTSKKLKVVQSATGKSRIYTDGLVGTIQFKYTGTIVQTVCFYVSTLSICGLVGWVVYLTIKKRIKSKRRLS